MSGDPVADEATLRRSELLARLRAARLAAGMTQTRVAAALDCSQGKINKIETGVSNIQPDDLNALLRLYNVPESERNEIKSLTALVGPAVPGRPRFSPAYLELLERERTAVEIRALHSERIPRLLQCERYLLTQFRHAGDSTDPTTLLFTQAERAKIFSQDNPPRYRVVLAESALHRQPGGRTPSMAIDQAKHLIDLGKSHPRVSIQILTYGAELPFLEPDFTVLKFGGRARDVAYAEHIATEIVFHRAKALRHVVAYWDQVHRAALNVDDSQAFLHDLIERAKRELGQDRHN